MENFEEELIKMTKPEISNLQHQDILRKTILNAKEKSALSWWWLCIPLYIIAALLMKSFFMHTTLVSNIHDLESKEKYFSLLIFLLLPVVFIVINFLSIRKIHFLSGSPGMIDLLKSVWFNITIIIASFLIILIYLL